MNAFLWSWCCAQRLEGISRKELADEFDTIEVSRLTRDSLSVFVPYELYYSLVLSCGGSEREM